jgi:glycosyltransferase involved in cell wall biosynthesis
LLLQTIQELKNHNHVLVYLHDSHDAIPNLPQHITTYNLDLRHNLSIPVATIRLRKIIQKHQVGIVHAHLWKSVLVARLATPKNVRLLFTLHSIMSKDAYESKVRLFLDRLLYRKNQEAIAVSQAVMEDFKQHVQVTGPQHILYNFVADKFFNLQRKNQSNKQFSLVAVGNLKEAKNYPFLLDALSHVKNIDFTLDIYGNGPQTEMLQKMIVSKKISVRLMGKERQIENVLTQYDLFVMTSIHEGYGLALAEAMAAGLPVLVSDIPSFKEVAADAAFYFSSNNVDSFISQVSEIHRLHQNGALTEWGNKSRARAREVASKEIYFKKLESIYTN